MSSFVFPLLATLLFDTLIAGFLTALGVGGGFAVNWLFSQSIGLSILLLTLAALRLPIVGWRRAAVLAPAIASGALLGGMLGRQLSDIEAMAGDAHKMQSWLIGLVFGTIAVGFFWLRERAANLERALQQRELARLEAEKLALAAQLRMLQAQIEPHFLFNSLANVAATIATDPPLAAHLLNALIRYLRASLMRTRAERGTLGDEAALLTAYLDVLKIRMGARLDYAFDIAPPLLALDFPPMLLQPLVENAIRHGLAPKLVGGRVSVSAQRRDSHLEIEVADDGLGFAATPGAGIGLANIRARLMALYGADARLELHAKVGAGATARLIVPLDEKELPR